MNSHNNTSEGREWLDARRRYSALIECFPGAFFELDSKGDFILTNKGARKLLGWCEEVVLRKRLAKKVPKEELYKLLVIFNQAVRKGRGRGCVELVREDAETIPVNLSVVPVREKGKITGFQCLIDSTGPIKQDPRLSIGGANLDLEALIYPLCYELSSSLTVAKGALELALSERGSTRTKFLALGRNALVRQHRVLRNLMDAFKLHRMESELYQSEVDLKDIIYSVAKELREPYKRRGLKIEVAVQEDLPRVTADAEKIRNVLHTLLDYAVMAWKSQEAIIVSGVKHRGYIEICIGCEGRMKGGGAVLERPSSMSIDELPFVPLGGIQVGLKIAEKIIKAHGGGITSQNLADGEAICFTLPVWRDKQR